MNLNVSVPLLIKNGIGELHYPEVFKKAPLQTHISCDSMYFNPNSNAKNSKILFYEKNHYKKVSKLEKKPRLVISAKSRVEKWGWNPSYSFLKLKY